MRRSIVAGCALAVAATIVAQLAWSGRRTQPNDGDDVPRLDALTPVSVDRPTTLAARGEVGNVSEGAMVPASARDPSMARVHGHVTSAEGPVAGASVRFVRRMGKHRFTRAGFATTDADGRYDAEVEPGDVNVTVDAEGWALSGEQFDAIEGTTYEKHIRLEPGTLAGFVEDGDGRRVAGVEIRAMDPQVARALRLDEVVETRTVDDPKSKGLARAVFSARSGADGRFEMRGFPVTDFQFFSASRAWFVLPTMTATRETPDVVVRVVPALSIEGLLRDAKTGAAVDASVSLSTGVPNANGRIRPFVTSTREGRFSCYWAAPEPLPAGTSVTVSVAPMQPEYDRAERILVFDRGSRSQDIEILVERDGLGELVLDVVTPAGKPFKGRIDAVAVARDGGKDRRLELSIGEDGQRRLAIPADHEWLVQVRPAPPSPGAFCAITRNHLIRVRSGGRSDARMVLPEYARALVHAPAGATRALFTPLDDGTEGEFDLRFVPGNEHGFWVYATEGRWRVSVIGKPDATRDVYLPSDAETVVDLR